MRFLDDGAATSLTFSCQFGTSPAGGAFEEVGVLDPALDVLDLEGGGVREEIHIIR